ncbi:MAG: DUF6883 domain-containing protein [Pseudomonadota bacterium]
MPGADQARIDRRKLVNYALDPTHPRGRHKARVFRASLGIDASNAEWLAEALLEGLAHVPATPEGRDAFGARWRTDHRLERNGKSATVRCLWLVPLAEAAPHLVTCYIPRR